MRSGNKVVDAETIRRYLLGQLPEDEQISIERWFLAGSDEFAEMLAAEDELLYHYIEGRLSGEARRQFEERILRFAAPSRLRFARALVRAAAGTVQDRRVPPFWLAAAAVILLAVGLVWELRLTESSAELDSQRDRIAALERAPKAARAPAAISFALLPGLTRGSGEQHRLELPPEDGVVEFQLMLKDKTAYAGYWVAMENANGSQVWSQTGLTPAGSGVTSVRFEVPSRVLAPDDYQIVLKGLREGLAPQAVAEYAFRITRR